MLSFGGGLPGEGGRPSPAAPPREHLESGAHRKKTKRGAGTALAAPGALFGFQPAYSTASRTKLRMKRMVATQRMGWTSLARLVQHLTTQ